MAQAVRNYLQLRFDLRAPRQSTDEFLSAVHNDSRLTPQDREFLRDLLQQCDLAKFARAVPTAEDCANSLAAARRFVDATSAPNSPANR